MKAKIISFHIGPPGVMEWQGRKVSSSMMKQTFPGPLVVHTDRIEGNIFSTPQYHGTIDSVLYAYGVTSAQKYMDELGMGAYEPGTTGETISLDEFDESQISVGDVFQFGEVLAQATYPRIPCGKLNFRLQSADGQAAMQRCGHSGVYFRILRPGEIRIEDAVERVEAAAIRFSLTDLYSKLMKKEKLSEAERKLVEANGALPANILARLS